MRLPGYSSDQISPMAPLSLTWFSGFIIMSSIYLRKLTSFSMWKGKLWLCQSLHYIFQGDTVSPSVPFSLSPLACCALIPPWASPSQLWVLVQTMTSWSLRTPLICIISKFLMHFTVCTCLELNIIYILCCSNVSIISLSVWNGF